MHRLQPVRLASVRLRCGLQCKHRQNEHLGHNRAHIRRLEVRGKEISRRTRFMRNRIALLLAVVGPGLITSNVDNDAGGITVYTTAGAQFGYTLLWSLIPMTIALYVSEEMCARMGVVTGKGLSDLIREEFGFRSTFFVMVAALIVDLGNTVAEFAGVAAASMQLRHQQVRRRAHRRHRRVASRRPTAAISRVEKIFLVACAFYLSYVISAVLAKPDWLLAAKETVAPTFHFNAEYLLMLTALDRHHDRAVAILLSAGRLRRKESRPAPVQTCPLDVLVGSISCMAIVFFIIDLLRRHISRQGPHHHQRRRAKPPKPSIPLAGKWAGALFAFGLLNASLFAASILPLSTAHVICEGLGFEAGIDHKLKEAPAFYSLYTGLIVVGAGIILIPKAPLFKILVMSQVANGVWLPVVLIFILLLINRRELMGELRQHARASTSSPGPSASS